MDLYNKFFKWYDNSGIFECYFKSTPFTTLKNYIKEISLNKDIKLYKKNSDNIEFLQNEGVFSNENTLYIIDLPSEDSIDYALILNNKLNIKPILSYNHIFNKYGIVGNEELANKMLFFADKIIENKNSKGFAFILDYNRYIENIDLNNPLLYNNQYEITEEELPYVPILQENNISNVILISSDIIKYDISNYISYLNDNNIKTKIISI